MDQPTLSRPTILIVDDNPTNLAIVADFLEASDFEVVTALDGQDALNTVNKAQPDLVLLDIMMPGLDGFEVCRRLKANEATREIPVIFMTALASTEDKVKGFEAGAVDYVTKPVYQEEILARVVTHLRIRALTRMERQRRRLAESLEETGRILSSNLDMRLVPDRILERLAVVVPYERGAVLLKEGDQTRVVAQHGFPADQQAIGLTLPIRSGDVFDQLMTTGRPLILGDVVGQTAWLQVEWLPVNKSWLGMPLIIKDKVIGMISLTRREANAFAPDDATVVATFAGQAAVALENAGLYDNIKRFNEELEQLVRQRTAELQQAYEQLKTVDRNKMDFIQTLARELTAPLNMFLDRAERLKSDLTVQRSLTLSRWVNDIHAGVAQLKDTVSNVVLATAIESGTLELKFRSVVFETLLQKVRQNFDKALRERRQDLKLDVAALPAIEADEERLRIVFEKLVENAIKYTPNGGHITIRGAKTPEGVEIVVSDTGIGVEPRLRQSIFDQFFHTGKTTLVSQASKTAFKASGAGLGLAIARGIIQAHGGRIWVESSGRDEFACPGSQFHLALPLRPGPQTAKPAEIA